MEKAPPPRALRTASSLSAVTASANRERRRRRVRAIVRARRPPGRRRLRACPSSTAIATARAASSAEIWSGACPPYGTLPRTLPPSLPPSLPPWRGCCFGCPAYILHGGCPTNSYVAEHGRADDIIRTTCTPSTAATLARIPRRARPTAAARLPTPPTRGTTHAPSTRRAWPMARARPRRRRRMVVVRRRGRRTASSAAQSAAMVRGGELFHMGAWPGMRPPRRGDG